MPQLQPREKKLLWAFTGLAFLLANFIGLRVGMDQRSLALSKIKSAKSALIPLKAAAEEAAKSEQTRTWTERYMHGYRDQFELETALLTTAKSKAASANLTEIQTTPKAPRTDPEKDVLAHKSVLDVKAAGGIEEIVRFLHSMQEKTTFIGVSSLTLTVNTKEEEKINLDATFEKWWRPDSLDFADQSTPSATAAASETGAPTPNMPAPEAAVPAVAGNSKTEAPAIQPNPAPPVEVTK